MSGSPVSWNLRLYIVLFGAANEAGLFGPNWRSTLLGQYSQATPRAFAGNILVSNKYEGRIVEIGSLLGDVWAAWVADDDKGYR